MYADRYPRPKTSPTSLAAAIAINAAVIAALLTSAPKFLVPPEKTLEGYIVPADPPPPPPNTTETKPETKTEITERLPVTPEPRIPTLPSGETITGTTDPGPIGDPVVGNPGTGVVIDPPLPPAPVLVDAAPDPRYARDFQPAYPPSERRAGTEGVVLVRVHIGANGRVLAIEPVRSASAAFFDATRLQALSRWRFKPATRDGVPVESWRTMTVRFVLEG